jgi:hypothetical protein
MATCSRTSSEVVPAVASQMPGTNGGSVPQNATCPEALMTGGYVMKASGEKVFPGGKPGACIPPRARRVVCPPQFDHTPIPLMTPSWGPIAGCERQLMVELCKS